MGNDTVNLGKLTGMFRFHHLLQIGGLRLLWGGHYKPVIIPEKDSQELHIKLSETYPEALSDGCQLLN